MSFDAGSIESRLDIDLTPFQRGLEQAKRKGKDFERNPIQARLEVDTKAATAKLDEWRKAQSGKSVSIGVDIDVKKATAELSALQQKLAATKGGTLTVNVSLDTRRATQQLATWRANHRAPLDIPLGINPKLATAELRAWRAAQAGETLHMDVDASTLGADTKMAEFRARESSKSIKQKVDVDTNSLASAKKKVEGFDKSLGELGKTAAAVTPSLRTIGFASLGYAAAAAVPYVGALGEALISLSKGAFLLPGAFSVAGASIASIMVGMGGVTSAFKAASAASATAGKSAKAQATANAQLDAALAKLAPSARDAVKALLGLKDSFDQMKLRVQQALFAGLGDEIRKLGSLYLPVLSGGMSQVSGAFNGAIKQVTGFLKASQTVQDIGVLFSDTAQIVRNLAKALRPVLDGLRDMGTVGVSYLRDVTTGAGSAAQKFADWARNMRQTGQFKHDLQDMGSTLHNLASIVVNVGGAFGALFGAMNVTGAGTLNLLREMTAEFNKWAHSLTGQSALIGFFTRLKEITDELKPAVHAVFDALGQAFQILAPVLPGIAQSFADIVRSLTPMIPMVAQLAGTLLPPLLKVLSDMGPVLVPLVASFIALRGAVKGLLGMGALVTTVTKLAGAFRALAAGVAAVKTAGLIGGLKGVAGVGKTVATTAGEAGAAGALTRLGAAAVGATGAAGGVTAAGASLATVLGVAGVAGAALAAAGGIAYLAVGAVKAAQNNDHLDATMVSTADNIAHNSSNLGQYRAEMNKWLAKQKDATTANTVYGSSFSDAAVAGKHFVDTGKEASKVYDLQNGALTNIASTLGVSLPQAFAIAKASGIKLTDGFNGNSKAAQHNRDVLDNLKKAGVGLDAKFKDLNNDIQVWTDKNATAAQKANVLGDVLGSATTKLGKADDATSSFYQDMDTLADSMNAAKGAALNASGGFDLTSEKGRTLHTAMQQAQSAMFNYATEAHKAGVPTATINQHLQEMRQKLIDTIIPFVGSRQAAEQLANKLGLIPGNISIAVSVKGGLQAEGAFDVLKGKIDTVTGPRTLVVHGLTQDAVQKLVALGFKVKQLPNGQFQVTANTDAAGQALAAMLGYVNGAHGAIHIDGNITPGQQKLLALINQGNGSVAWAKLDADSDPGKRQLAELIQKIQSSGGNVTIDGNRVPANMTTDQLVNWINTHPHGVLGVDADTSGAQNAFQNLWKDWGNRTAKWTVTMYAPDVNALSRGPGGGGGGLQGFGGGAFGGLVTSHGIVHASSGTIIPGYAPGKDIVPALLSPGESVLTPELTQAVGPKNILAANASATLPRAMSRLAGGGVSAPLTHNGAPRTRYFEDFSANYADGSSWNPDTGSFDSPAVTSSRQAAASSYVAGLSQAFNIPPVIATVKATTFAGGGVAGLNPTAPGAPSGSVSSPSMSTPTGTEQLSAQGLKQTTTQTKALVQAVQSLRSDWAKTAGVVTSTVVPAFTQTSAVVAAQAVGAVGGLAAYVPLLATQFTGLAGATRVTWGQVAAAITGSHTQIGASQAGLQAEQTGSWNAIATAVGSADSRMSVSQRGLQASQTASWNGIASAVVASHSRITSSQAVLQGQQAASWNAIASALVLADGRMNTSQTATEQHMFTSWNAIAGNTGSSVTRQNQAFGSLEQGMTQVRAAMTQTAGWAETQYGRIRGAAERPIHDVLTLPFNQGIIAGWNSLDAQFKLNHHVNPVPVPFAAGGPVTGPGGPTDDKVPAVGPGGAYALSNGEYVVNAHSTARHRPLLEAINSRRFADGGLVGGTFFGGLVDPAFNKVPGMIAKILATYPGNLAAIDGTDIAKQGVDGAKKALQELLSQMMASFGVLRNGAVVSAAVRAEQAYALSQFPLFGWGPDQMGPLIALWNGESGWDPTIANGSSGAYGIPQALPASKMAAAGPDWRTNPATQINWGLSYIKSTYGSPAGAYGAWLSRSPHWYGEGVQGAVFDQPTLIGVGEKGAERVDVTPLHGSAPGTVTLSRESVQQIAQVIASNRPLSFEVYGATQETVSDLVDDAMFKVRHVGKGAHSG